MGDFRRANPFFTWIVRLSRPFLLGPLRLKSYGVENVPKDGGFVVASNHASMLDPWPIGFPLYPRQIHYMAKAELYKNPVLKWILMQGRDLPRQARRARFGGLQDRRALRQGGRRRRDVPRGNAA